MESVQIPESVSVIGEGAFEDCVNLTVFSGAEGVRQIRDRAFAGCPIRTVTIPASVEQIGLRAFDNDKIKDGVVYFAGDKLRPVPMKMRPQNFIGILTAGRHLPEPVSP